MQHYQRVPRPLTADLLLHFRVPPDRQRHPLPASTAKPPSYDAMAGPLSFRKAPHALGASHSHSCHRRLGGAALPLSRGHSNTYTQASVSCTASSAPADRPSTSGAFSSSAAARSPLHTPAYLVHHCPGRHRIIACSDNATPSSSASPESGGSSSGNEPPGAAQQPGTVHCRFRSLQI